MPTSTKRDDSCPRCDSDNVKSIDGDVYRCRDCGTFFEVEDDLDGLWDRSSRHKTRLEREFDEE